ncbi:MAG TPA: hypothetical protein DIT64_19410 [Verrucomicrobiales bacterium]|nr:hypothetical protein [Verrucomicrobiales bacterium]
MNLKFTNMDPFYIGAFVKRHIRHPSHKGMFSKLLTSKTESFKKHPILKGVSPKPAPQVLVPLT